MTMKNDYLNRKAYPTDLTVVDNGCKWRALPHEGVANSL